MAGKPGAVRVAVLAALRVLAVERGHANAREIAAAAKCGLKDTARALENMTVTNEVVVVGRGMRAGTRFSHNLYEPVQVSCNAASGAAQALAGVLGAWHDAAACDASGDDVGGDA
jgi:Flp pilus assembly protein CpaB